MADISNYSLVFEDHFNNQLDTNKWIKFDYTTHSWMSCRSAENSYTENGNYTARIDYVQCPGDPSHYARSGGIATKERWLYGYFEIRAKLASGTGISSSFWLVGSKWPPEIDVFETAGYQDRPNKIYYSIHYDTDNKSKTSSYDSPNYSDDYHIFGCEWTPDEIRYYMDGVLKGTHPTQESMKVPMDVRLTISKGWGVDNYPAQEILPKHYYVDYVRVYQNNDATINIRRNKQMDILTNLGYTDIEKLKTMLGIDQPINIISKPQKFTQTITHALTDANNGKLFTISNFPTSCIIKEIRVRSNFTSGLQNWKVAFTTNPNGITPTDTSITCDTAEIFGVGDYINIEDEIAYVSAADVVNKTITVTRGVKGTTPSYHNFRARMETANDGLRLILFNNSSRKLTDKLKIIKYLMTWKGTTNAAIVANDKAIKFTNIYTDIEPYRQPVIGKYKVLYLIDGTNSERTSIEAINGTITATADPIYKNTIYVADPLLAHPTNIEVQKQVIYDIPTVFSTTSGTSNANLYGTLYVDEKIDSTLYANGITVTVEIIAEVFYSSLLK